ncbi:hypothetical protein ScPMuIL_001834 [Solemya velum]
MTKKKIHLPHLPVEVEAEVTLVKESMCSVKYLLQAIKIAALAIFYYIFSIGLTFYNQRFVRHFKFPISFTICHLVIKFILASLVRKLIECKKQEARVMLSWPVYLKRLAPTGIASALDIGLSNWSFEFITVSLYTMTKSTAVIFILGFSLLFKLEKFRYSLILIVLLISGGLFMFTYHSTQFNLEGFIMVMAASSLSGLRWTLAQIVTQKSEIGLHNPIDMMYHVQPWMIVGLLPLSAAFEGLPLATSSQAFRYKDSVTILENLGLIFAGSFLAFMLEFSEYLFLTLTSSLTFCISGIIKEICTLCLAAMVNGDQINLVNGTGLVLCLLGIATHVIFKAISMNEKAGGKEKILSQETIEMLTRDGDANELSDEDVLFAQNKR